MTSRSCLLGNEPPDQLDRVDGKHADSILMVSMEVRAMVRPTTFNEHSDHDTEEAADFRHWREFLTRSGQMVSD